MATTSLDIVINAVDEASGTFNKIGGVAKGLALGGVAALGAATIAVGKQAFDMAMEYDSALDTITVATGAGGAALDEMGDAVKRLYGSKAGRGQGLSDIATVMGEVASRTNATGKTLETFTGQMLKLSNLTGTDANTNVESLTRLMNQFDVASEDAAKTMDLLYVGTQQSGLGLDEMLGSLQTLAPITQAFGLDLDDTVGFLDILTDAGITAAQAQTGLKSAIVAMREDGIEPSSESFASMIDAINGPNGLNEAIDLFGAKAGPAFFQAIRDGKIDVDSLSAALGPEGMKGAIDKAMTRTEDFPDSWDDAQRLIGVSLGEVGGHMLNFLNEYGVPFAEWFGNTVPAAIGNTLTALDKFLEKIKQPAEGEYGAGENPFGKQMLDWAGQGLQEYGKGGAFGGYPFTQTGQFLEGLGDILYPAPPEYSGKPYPSGGGSVPYYDAGYDPNAGAGADIYMTGRTTSGERYVVPYQINVYGNVTTQAIQNQIDDALQGQGVR